MSTCLRCGCTTPCSCTNYSEDRCARCGCTQPCACTNYTQKEE